MTDDRIDELTRDEAMVILKVEECINEKIREEREMQAIANDMTTQARRYLGRG